MGVFSKSETCELDFFLIVRDTRTSYIFSKVRNKRSRFFQKLIKKFKSEFFQIQRKVNGLFQISGTDEWEFKRFLLDSEIDEQVFLQSQKHGKIIF